MWTDAPLLPNKNANMDKEPLLLVSQELSFFFLFPQPVLRFHPFIFDLWLKNG